MNEVWISELEIIIVLKHNSTTITFIRKLGLSIVLNRLFMYLFIFGCTGSSFAPCGLFLIVMSRGHCLLRVQVSRYNSFSCCRAQTLGTQVSAVAACRLNRCGTWA